MHLSCENETKIVKVTHSVIMNMQILSLHYFYNFRLVWDAGMAAAIAASAMPMVCALPCSTQNVNHIRNHRAFCDLNIPSEKLEIIACYNNKDPRFSKNHFTW